MFNPHTTTIKHFYILGLPSTPESEKKLDLADVEIEEDDDALKEFLGTSESDIAIAGLSDFNI